MKLKHFVIYLIIGGIITGFIDREVVNKCGRHLSDEFVLIMPVVYPAVITAAFITKSDGSYICGKSE